MIAKSMFTGGAGLFAMIAASASASAQTSPSTAAPTAPDAVAAAEPAPAPAPPADDARQTDIVVTGSARPQRRFDASYAVNTLGQSQIQRLAPRSMADLLGTLPGIQVEATGGEVQNITRVRGIPTDRGYLYFQQDGLPLFHDLDGFFFNQGDGMNRPDLMTARIDVVRGGPAPIYASGAAAIANSITVTGTDTPHGQAQVTYGTTGLYRLDLLQSGPLGDRTHFAVGGFLRQHEGFRDNGFPQDRGGQIRGNITHELDNGSIKLSGQYVNDHNIFYLSIPTNDPRDPSVSLDRYIDYFTGTINTPALRNVNIRYRDGAGTIQTKTGDLADGRHMRFANAALGYEADFGDWHVSAKGGYTQGKLRFDAFYSTSNPVDATSFAAGYLNASRTAFGTGVARLGYAIAGTNGATAYNPGADSGLVMQAQYRSILSDFYSGQGDLSVTRKFVTPIGTHDIRVGTYGSLYGESQFLANQNYLVEIRSQPRTLDLVAYSATGGVLGSVTDNGALADASTLNGGDVDGQVVALYGTDSWALTDRLRIDLGVRHEWYSYTGFARITGSANLGNAATLADDNTRAFTGAINTFRLKQQATNWTIGANYDLTDDFGAYARASQLEIPANATIAFAFPTPAIVTTKAKLYELGLKAALGRSYLYVTGFYTKFDPLNASFAAFNPVTGRSDQTINFIGTAEVKGVEADGQLRVAGPFSLGGSFTWQDPKYLNFGSNTGADGSRANGRQIIREPKIFLNVRPTVDIVAGAAKISLFGRYDYVGKRFTDFFNTTALPAYGYFGVGASVEQGGWRLQLAGDNITNAHGFTEGNTAGDRFGQGTPSAIFGRPLFGRNFRVIVSRKW